MGHTYTGGELYAQVLSEMGGAQVTGGQRTAIQNRIADALVDIWESRPWTWRQRRMDITVSPSTPYYELPSNYDGMTLSCIYRRDTDDGEEHVLRAATDLEFERALYDDEDGEPRFFRIARRAVGATYKAVLEVAPTPDAAYAYAGVGYYTSAPAVSFTSGTATDMPSEFHDLWHEAALSEAAVVLGLAERADVYRSRYLDKLKRASGQRDDDFPKGPPRSPRDPYGDLSYHR